MTLPITPARGHPDSGVSTYSGSAIQTDQGQVLSGLYHFDRVDQRGRVALVETWGEGAYAWQLTGFGVALAPFVVVALPVLFAFVPPAILKFTPGANVINDVSDASRSIFFGSSTRLGIEAAISVITAMGEFRVQADYRTAAGARFIMRLKFDPIAGGWYVTTPTGDVLIASRPATGIMVYQQAKVIGDWSTGLYTGALVGDTYFDLTGSNLAMLASGSTDSARCIFDINARGNSGGGFTPFYCGYAVLTRDEP